MSANARAAYGNLAERAAAAIAPDDPVIVFDDTGAAEALRDAVWRKFRNERFFVRPVIGREFAKRADAVAADIMRSFPDLDHYRVAAAQAFDGTVRANGRTLRERPAYNAGALRLMQAVVNLSDGIATTSHAELRRTQEILAVAPRATFFDLRDPLVPAPIEGDLAFWRDAVVIWAPGLTEGSALYFVSALADLHAPILLVSDAQAETQYSAQRVAPGNSRDALKRAKLILIAAPYGAETALALAAWSAPLVVDMESGAQERLPRARTFDRRRFGSIFDAVVSALADSPSHVVNTESEMTADCTPDEVEGPLVSIVMPTFDRPQLLRYALESCRRQSYRNIETIVAVGGGSRFNDVAEAYPDVRFIYLDENIPAASINAAFAQARGEYVTVLNDDDLFFPHHVSSLVSALERSGGAAAHGDVLTAYLRGDEAALLSLYGFESNMSRSVDSSSMLVANRIGATSAMVRRSCLPQDLYDMSIPCYRDYALWLSLAVKHDFIHVDRITSCYTIRNSGAAQQSTALLDKAVAAYQAIYERHCASERPFIAQQRAQMLQSVSVGATSLIPEPAMHISPVNWPPF